MAEEQGLGTGDWGLKNCGWLLGGRAGCWVTLSAAARSAWVTGRYWQQRAACGRSMQPSADVPSVQPQSL